MCLLNTNGPWSNKVETGLYLEPLTFQAIGIIKILMWKGTPNLKCMGWSIVQLEVAQVDFSSETTERNTWQEARSHEPTDMCKAISPPCWKADGINMKTVYRISGIFCVDFIFAEFATTLKSPKIDIAKNKPYYTSSLRVLEIAKIGLGEY